MNIRDIINAATPARWISVTERLPIGDRHSVETTSGELPVDESTIAQYLTAEDARFIAAYDPEHISMMEDFLASVVDAVTSTKTDGEVLDEIIDTALRITEYRKERGLNE